MVKQYACALIKDQLEQLPCFKYVDDIVVLDEGLSYHCYKIKSGNKFYFAKYYGENSTVYDNTVQVNCVAGNIGLSPSIIFQSEQWLISEFIQGDNLKHRSMTTSNKIKLSLSLLTQCHALSFKSTKITVPELSFNKVIKELLNKLNDVQHFSSSQDKAFSTLYEQIDALQLDEQPKALVLCHGDLNFSNVMCLNDQEQSYLVDFDCACFAEKEYDIAMMLAVNELGISDVKLKVHLEIIKNYYQKCNANSQNVSLDKVTRYFCICCLINTLWYFLQYLITNNERFRNLSEIQCDVLEGSCIDTYSTLYFTLKYVLR